jgi:hypothetical protein
MDSTDDADAAHRTRRRWLAVGLGAVLVVGVVAFALFRPDKLFVDEVADEQLDSDVAAALEQAEAPPSTTSPPDDASPENPSPTTAAPTTTEPAGPVVLSSGSWASLDHPTTGGAAIVTEGGTSTLVLSDLATDNGPDLYVYLSPEAGATDVDGALRVDRLRGNLGTQTYELPPDVDASAFRSVLIWCDRFASGFGTATLSPV